MDKIWSLPGEFTGMKKEIIEGGKDEKVERQSKTMNGRTPMTPVELWVKTQLHLKIITGQDASS